MYEFLFGTRKPQEVTAYDTLSRPFDEHIWILAIASTAIVYSTLVLMQVLWVHQTEEQVSSYHLYQGPNILFQMTSYGPCSMLYFSSQIFVLQYF